MPRQPRPINNAIVAAYVAGATVPEVARQLGVPANQVYTQLQRAQVPLRSQARSLAAPPSPAASDAIGAAYLAGASLTAIAQHHGLSRPAVSRRLRLAGIATRSPGPRSQPINDAIIAAYAAGETVTALSRQRGVTTAAISKLLRRAGIAPRPRSSRSAGTPRT